MGRKRVQRCLVAGGIAAALLSQPVLGACGDPGSISIAGIKARDAALDGRAVAVEGRVSAAFPGHEGLGGFYIQHRGDDSAVPSGIFVYTPDRETSQIPAVGTPVRLEARVGHHAGRVQLEWLRGLHRCSGKAGIEPVELEMPASVSRLERLEDVLVTLGGTTTVSGNASLARYGSLRLSSPGRVFHSGNGTPQQGIFTLVLDDGSYRRDPRPIPHVNANGTRRDGARVAAATGILTAAFGAHRLHPVVPVRFDNANPRPKAPLRRHGTLRVVGFNLDNYFLTLGTRGAESADAFRQQRRKIVSALNALDADILGLVELENDPRSVGRLIRALNAGKAPDQRYAAAAAGRALGDAALRVALLYRPSRLEPVEVRIGEASVHSRAPVAAVFRRSGGKGRVGAVVAHLKSKAGCPATGDVDHGAGCWNRLRTRQAQATLKLVNELRELHPSEGVVLLGDLNSYAGEPPVRTLVEAGLRDLAAEHVSAERRYSYVYRGQAGYLDYALADERLARHVADVAFWHINADEPPHLAYNSAFGGSGPFRSSDHDPIVVDLY